MCSRYKVTAAACAAVVLLGAMASSAFAYPSQVTDEYRIETTFGTCVVYVAARAEAVPAVIGRNTGTESVHCESLTVTPYRIYLSGGFGGASLDVLNLTDSGQPDRTCEWQKACFWSRSKAWFPPGDQEIRHAISIDLTPESTSTRYFSSVPAGCEVTVPDSGRVKCVFRQWVTTPAPAQ